MRSLLLLVLLSLIAAQSSAQSNCGVAFLLCNGQPISRNNQNGGIDPVYEPVLSCGDGIIHNNLWFQFTAISTGNANITVSNINNNPGLAMEVYTGTCGALLTTGNCTTGSSATGGTMSLTVAVTAGTTYYVMVDGENGNYEPFTISANSPSITSQPATSFDPSPASGCVPFTTTLQNTTTLQGGTNISYSWNIDNGGYISSSGIDTSVSFNFVGSHTVELRVCNQECGCVSQTKSVLAQDLLSSISYSPATACLGTTITFDGLASIVPDPPFTDPDVTSWLWNFDDPGSGTANTASGQSVTHDFVGPQTLFNVQLIVVGLCGPDTVYQLIDLNPRPTLQATSGIICEGANATLTASVQGATPPYTYAWSGINGSIQCSSCATTSVSGLTAGGPYSFDIVVTDALGCTADTTVEVIVNPIPVVSLIDTVRACPGSNVTLFPSVTTGNGPFGFLWTPSAGLSDPTLQNPVVSVSGDASYCVVATDAAGCSSSPVCTAIETPDPPTVNPVIPTICASDPNPQNTFEVIGASPGSSITWSTSPDYNLIIAAPFDSTFISVSFPQGIAGTYVFIAIIEDITTGCIDTIPVPFTLSNANNLSVTIPAPICEGASTILSASGSSTYSWTAVPSYTFTDPSSASQTVAPDTTTLFIVTGTTGTCTTSDTVLVVVHPIPVVDPIAPWQICGGSSISIVTNVTAGTPPLTFSWTPLAGVSDPTVQNPTFTPTSPTNYCLTVTDSIGCSSSPQCVSITFYDPPTISAAVSTVCASDPVPQNTFMLNGPSAGSTVSWAASPDYPLIVSSSIDSMFITVNFPPNQAGTYDFTAIVEDFTTGCIDTVTTSFTLTTPSAISVTGPDTTCSGTTVNLSATGSTGYSWSSIPSIGFTDPTQPNQTVLLDTTTTFIVGGGSGDCSLPDTFTVFVHPKPSVDVVPLTPTCGCDTVLLTGASNAGGPIYQWTAGNGLPLTNPNGTSTLGFACNGDLFTLQVTDFFTGCTNDSTVIAIARNSPNAVASVSPTLICPGVPTLITLDGSGSDAVSTVISWSSSDLGTVISDPSSLTTEATVSNTTVFTITVTDAYGCDSTASDTVFIQTPPSVSGSLPYLCTSDPSLQSTISITGAGSGSSYDWYNIPSCVSPASATDSIVTFDFSNCGVGSYTFEVRITDPTTGCVTDTNYTVNVISGVVISFDQDTVTICEGDVANVVASGANTYSWSNGAANDSVQFIGLTAAGSPYIYSVIGTVGSCTATDSIVVIVNPVNSIGPIQGPSAVCSNDSSITYVASPAGGNFLWEVNGGSIIDGQGTDTITVVWGLGLSGNVILYDTSTTGCPADPDTLNVSIIQSPGLPPIITGNFNVCDSTLETYSAFVFPPVPGSIFTWTITNGQIVGSDTGSSVTVQWPDSGSGTVSVIETSQAGCNGPVGSVLITINDVPEPPVISGDSAICQGSSGYYAVELHPGAFYSWIVGNGGNQTGASQYNDSIYVYWSNAGNWQVSVVETNIFGCSSDTITFDILVNTQPSADVLTDSLSFCQGSSINLSSNSSFGVLQWTTSGSGSFSDTTSDSPSYQTGYSDTGRVVLTLTSSGPGCDPVSDSVAIGVRPVPVIVATSSADTVCYGTADTLSVSGIGAVVYSWTPGGLSDSVITVNPQLTTTYTVTATAASGCTTIDTVTVNVIPPGIPDAGNDILACLGDLVPLNGTQLNGTGLIWTTGGDGAFTPSDTLAAVNYVPGTTDTTTRSNYIYLTTIGACLNQTDTMVITYGTLPTVYAGPDTLLTSGFTAGVQIPLQPVVTNAPGVIWSTSGTGFFSPSDTSLQAVYLPSEEDFTLDSIIITLISTGGCQQAGDDFIIEISPFNIPNVFTPYPASPGKNDYFVIHGLPESSWLRIYDRWGKLVFESKDYRNNWDAANMEAETFYYILISGGRDFHGWVQVIRED